MTDIPLSGARATQLAGWLKGVGVLRLVAEQEDPDSRLRWEQGQAILTSRLDHDGLHAFLLERYRPAPVCSPWNGGSGFFAGDKVARSAHDRVLIDQDPRFAELREAIEVCRQVVADRGLHAKPADDAKPALIAALRARLPEQAVRWLDAVAVLTDDKPAFPPLLGSGGNDGRWELSSNFARAVVTALGLEASKRGEGTAGSMLDAALFGASGPLARANLGPLARDDSPSRSPQLRDSEDVGNPWDLVLAVEGSLLLGAAAARRLAATGPSLATAPFTVRPTAAGYGSAVAGEGGRAEIWLPTWARPAALAEVEALLREGRAQIGARSARTGLEMARAAGSLGVARGLEGFERHVLLARAGRDHLAVHAGRVDVVERPEAAILAGVDEWWRRLAAWTEAPAGVRNATRALEHAMFELAARGGPAAAARFVIELGRAEAALVRSGAAASERGLRPLAPRESVRWVRALGPSPEAHAAVSLASLRDPGNGRAGPRLRDYLLGTGVDDRGRPTYDPPDAPAIERAARPAAVLAQIHARRWLDAGFPFPLAVEAEALELVAIAAGGDGLDLERVLALARGLCGLDWSDIASWRPASDPAAAPPPAPVFELLSLAWRGTRGHRLQARPDWTARLRGGAVGPVLREAMLRLELGGLRPLARPEDLLSTTTRPRASGDSLVAALLLRPARRTLDLWAERHCEEVRVLAPGGTGDETPDDHLADPSQEPEVPARA